MISLIPTTAAPAAAGRATARGARASGDAFAAKLQKAVKARQPAERPTDDRMPAGEPSADETANDEITNDQSTNDPTAATRPKHAGDDTPKVATAPHGENNGTASTVTAAATSVVAPPPVAVAASPTPAATAATAEPSVPATAASPSPTPAAVPTSDETTTTATPVEGEPVPVANGDAAATKSADAPAPPAMTGGLVADTAVLAKVSMADESDDGDDSKPRRGGSARAEAVAAGGHLVGPAEVVVTGSVANQAGERVGAAPVSAEPVATATHADHQAVARAADVLTTDQHTGPMTTNRLSLEMDGSSRVAVRMDDTGRLVRVDVLADPTGRLDGSWRADMSEGLRNHGLELDQRGADTRGEGHHREDQPDDRFATDGGLPRKPVRSRPARPGSLWL